MRRLLVLIVALAAAQLLNAQVRPVYDRGTSGLDHLLGRLQTIASALHTGAHPDDEDSALIARVARGDHARVAYLALNRGEGGQNIIGPELFEALGVIRTEELLQARRLDGGEQFFTRTMDYGFSKTRSEAAAKWGEREVLGDMVRIIRMYRPLVIFSRFSGTPADGHGHHQLAGYLTPLAFKAAADPKEFPEQLSEGLRPWQARKLYVGQGFRADPQSPPTTRVQTGEYDPILGRTYAAIASEGRSQHKSQEMGSIEPLGPQASALRLLQGPPTPASATETSLFDGLDTSIGAIASVAGLPPGTLRVELAAVQDAAAEALRTFNAEKPRDIIPALARGLTATRAARAALGSVSPDSKAEAEFLLAIKEHDFIEALVLAAGVTVDPLADTETANPGETLTVSVRTFLNGATSNVGAARISTPRGWTAEAMKAGASGAAEPRFQRETPSHTDLFRITVPADAAYTQPYWLTQPRQGDLFVWPEGAPKGLPFAPPLLSASVPLTIGGVNVEVQRPVEYRYADRIRGELRRAVEVVPAVSIGLSSRLVMVPIHGKAASQSVTVEATSLSRQPVSGVLSLRTPDGWQTTPASAPLNLKAGERTAVTFALTPPPSLVPGTVSAVATAVIGGQTYQSEMQLISYPHISPHRLYRPAAVQIQALDLTVADVRVGYIMGSGDQVPEAIRRMGLTVELIDPAMLSSGDLSRFDTIVVGIRASEARPDFVANQARLREFMERGGTLIVQYQQNDYTERQLAPLKGEIGARVTDETAPVRILQPSHPLFTFPNAITSADFNGWVQERNLYAFLEFDKGYTPLLESGDPGEAPNRGGELYVDVGKGHYVYTSYAWFRQLPAGVPGAYRLFANLLSLPKSPR